MSHKSYDWEYRLEVDPYDKIMDVLDAFFSSYPDGDYACEKRERYKLLFRRGAWKKSLLGLGELVPARLVKGQFEQWPLIVRVLARPSPQSFAITVRYEVHLPSSISKLPDPVQGSVDAHARKEVDRLAEYLAECIGMKSPPEVQSD